MTKLTDKVTELCAIADLLGMDVCEREREPASKMQRTKERERE